MNKPDTSKYESVLNTYIHSLLIWGKNRYRGKIENISKRMGIHSSLSNMYSKVSNRYPYIHQTEFEDKTIKFHVNSPPERSRVRSLKYVVLDRIHENLKSDDIFFDVGAGIGTLSCAVGSHLADGKVYAFEPLPANIKAIQRNFERNKIEGDVFQCALSKTDTEMSFSVPDQSVKAGYTNAALLPEYTKSNFWDDKVNDIKVSARAGDNLIQEEGISVPNIVAIDVEGAEMKVIEGLENTLSNDDCRAVFCEVHEYLLSDFGTSSEKLENKLKDLGFSLETFDRREYETGGENKSLYRIAAYK